MRERHFRIDPTTDLALGKKTPEHGDQGKSNYFVSNHSTADLLRFAKRYEERKQQKKDRREQRRLTRG